MSRHAYENLTIIPDFSSPPVYGLAGSGGRVDTAIGQGDHYAAWRGSTQLAFGFAFRCKNGTAATALREALNRYRGRSTAFYLPSWRRDFQLAADASVGDGSITIVDGLLSEMTENRPDTEGRVLFLATPSGNVQIVGVETATDDGGNEVLTIDQPLVYDFDQSKTMIGFAHLVRLAADEASWRYDAPGQASVELRFVSVRNRREVDQALEVQSEQVLELLEIESAVAVDEDGDLTRRLAPTAIGPDSYGASQGYNYLTEWRATFSDPTTVELEQLTSGAIETSALYDGLIQTNHLGFGFDSGDNEVLAWHLPEPGQSRIRYYAGGFDQTVDFPGVSPQVFNSWTLDGENTLGDAETVVFYVRPGFSALFGRFERESYGTERRIASLSTALIYLHGIRYDINQMLIDAMDAQHRNVVLRSAEYGLLPTVEHIAPTISVDVGEYVTTVIPADSGSDTMTPSFSIDDAVYLSPTVTTDVLSERIIPEFTISDSAYINTVIPADSGSDTMTPSFSIDDAVYFESAVPSGVETESITPTFSVDVGAYVSE